MNPEHTFILVHDVLAISLQYHPGTNITAIDLFNGVYSILPMWTQTNFLIRHVAKLQKEHPEGNHLLCFSQGN